MFARKTRIYRNKCIFSGPMEDIRPQFFSVILRLQATEGVIFFIHKVIYFARLTPVCFVPIFSHS
jgi:hypothetical protein